MALLDFGWKHCRLCRTLKRVQAQYPTLRWRCIFPRQGQKFSRFSTGTKWSMVHWALHACPKFRRGFRSCTRTHYHARAQKWLGKNRIVQSSPNLVQYIPTNKQLNGDWWVVQRRTYGIYHYLRQKLWDALPSCWYFGNSLQLAVMLMGVPASCLAISFSSSCLGNCILYRPVQAGRIEILMDKLFPHRVWSESCNNMIAAIVLHLWHV